MTSGESMARLLFDNFEIAYHIAGEGVSIVFIHQTATDHRLWTHQYSYFQTRYRTVTIDVLGHGGVPWPLQEFSIERAAHYVKQVIERLAIGPVFVIGVSMGAAIALRLALDAPFLVRGLGLVSPWKHAEGDLQSLINQLFRLAQIGDLAAHNALLLRYSFPEESSADYQRKAEWLRSLMLEQDSAAVAYTWASCLACDLRGLLQQIKVPGLVIVGLQDLFAPPYLAREVAEALSEVELEVWEETGHFPFLEDPERFNRRLGRFIQRCLRQIDTS